MGVAFTVDIILSMALSAAMHAYVKGKISHMWASYICIIQFASTISFQVFDYASQGIYYYMFYNKDDIGCGSDSIYIQGYCRGDDIH